MANDVSKFELKLVVIAILIPVFLETFPKIIRAIPVEQTAFTLRLPELISYILGLMWFVVLSIGLLNLTNIVKKKNIGKGFKFNIIFNVLVFSTLIVIGWLTVIYLVYFLSLLINFFLVIGIMFIIYIIGWVIYYLRWKNEQKK